MLATKWVVNLLVEFDSLCWSVGEGCMTTQVFGVTKIRESDGPMGLPKYCITHGNLSGQISSIRRNVTTGESRWVEEYGCWLLPFSKHSWRCPGTVGSTDGFYQEWEREHVIDVFIINSTVERWFSLHIWTLVLFQNHLVFEVVQSNQLRF